MDPQTTVGAVPGLTRQQLVGLGTQEVSGPSQLSWYHCHSEVLGRL